MTNGKIVKTGKWPLTCKVRPHFQPPNPKSYISKLPKDKDKCTNKMETLTSNSKNIEGVDDIHLVLKQHSYLQLIDAGIVGFCAGIK